MNINDLYPERTMMTMLLATALASFIMTIIVAFLGLFLGVALSEKINILNFFLASLYLLPIFLMCMFFSFVPMVLIWPPIAILISKLFAPNSTKKQMIMYIFSVILGVTILYTLLTLWNNDLELLAAPGAIWGASAAYMWNKLMLNDSPECNDTA